VIAVNVARRRVWGRAAGHELQATLLNPIVHDRRRPGFAVFIGLFWLTPLDATSSVSTLNA
jgi:hypothetical protein